MRDTRSQASQSRLHFIVVLNSGVGTLSVHTVTEGQQIADPSDRMRLRVRIEVAFLGVLRGASILRFTSRSLLESMICGGVAGCDVVGCGVAVCVEVFCPSWTLSLVVLLTYASRISP